MVVSSSSVGPVKKQKKDLRIEDNPALAAAARDEQALPVYIWCPAEEGQFYPGRVSRWWLKQSLAHLNKSLKSLGSALVLIKAESTLTALLQCVNAVGATKVVYNHLYDPISLVRDHNVKQKLVEQGICVQSFKGDLLYEPWEVYDERGHAFTTFNAFWNKCLSMSIEPASFFPPWRLNSPAGMVESCSIEDLGFENELEKSSNALLGRGWSPGWSNADKALAEFVDHHLIDYSKNSVKLEGTTSSFLSPYLHFGELSVRKVFQCIRMKQILWAKEGNSAGEENVNLFLRALGLREYSRYLCFNFPFTHERSLMSNLRFYPWRSDHAHFKAWRQGRTGYPLVDAGMRELWATGWMHNRIRVIVSSFFVKFLLLPWTWGMKYFWDTLLDADLESDILGWQYISGSLPDGHELDRLDSPQVQGCKFDPEGEYVRCWLPELARMPTEWIHHPWDAPSHLLKAAGVDLGLNYPKPIVDIDLARERLADALSIMWESEAAARAANANGTEEVVMDNLDGAETWGIPTVVLKENVTPNISLSSDQRVPSLQNYNKSSSLRKRSIDWKEEIASCNNLQKQDSEPGSLRTDEDLHSTAESTSAKKRNNGGERVMPPPLCSSLKAKPVSECEPPDLSQPWQKENEKEKASSKEGECA